MIREQYHMRRAANGVDAWDIRKLLMQHGADPVHDVALSDIAELDENWWFDIEGTPTPRALAHHMEMVQQVDRSYPILLDAEGRLMDGMHRVMQALLAGDTTIRAIRLDTTPPPDFTNIAPGDLPYGESDDTQ
ncbi:hypothetical protein [Tateyamaria sp. SN3-11]|uniref:hypothetical protein n=1 Tax=Tateyamaria sp. SN3-11 TaxID=3092147 RepID=UPI0039ED3740